MNEGCIMTRELSRKSTNLREGKNFSISQAMHQNPKKDKRESKGQRRAGRTKDGKQELAAIFYDDKMWKMSPNFIVA